METVTLQFETPQDLTTFRKSMKDAVIQVDIHNLTILCECTRADIARAMNNGAIVIEKKFKS